ncbi:MFS transporter [Gammaproteobacteria bacterium]|nr:MFS transporter [Gammaproteobacteria bacterium]
MRANSTLLVLLFGAALMMVANGLQSSLLSYRAVLDGFSTSVTGFVQSGYFIGLIVGSYLSPRLVKDVGHVRVFGAYASIASVTILAHGIYVDPTLWFAMRVINGLCFSGLYIVCESWINDLSTNESRGRMLAIYMIAVWGGMTTGQLLLVAAPAEGMTLFVLVSVVMSLGLVPILLTAKAAPSFEGGESLGLLALWRLSPLVVVSMFLMGIGHATVFALGPVYGRAVGMDIGRISDMMAAFMAGALLFQFWVGKASDRVDRRVVILVVSAAAAGASVTTMLLPTDGWMFLVGCLFMGGLMYPMYSLALSYANDRLRPEQMVAASATLVLTTGVGLALGPNIASVAMDYFGSNGFFLTCAVSFAGISIFTVFRMGAREAVAVDDRGESLATGPIGYSIQETVAADLAEDYDMDEADSAGDPLEWEEKH